LKAVNEALESVLGHKNVSTGGMKSWRNKAWWKWGHRRGRRAPTER